MVMLASMVFLDSRSLAPVEITPLTHRMIDLRPDAWRFLSTMFFFFLSLIIPFCYITTISVSLFTHFYNALHDFSGGAIQAT